MWDPNDGMSPHPATPNSALGSLPWYATPHYTTLHYDALPHDSLPNDSTTIINEPQQRHNIPIPDSPSLPIPRPTTRAPATRTRTNLFPFILDGPGMSLHFPRLHLAPYPSRSETKLCYLEPRALRGRRHRRRQETGPTHVACLFFFQEPGFTPGR